MIFSVLVDEWGGGHRVKGDEKQEEALSSLGEIQPQERVVRENHVDAKDMMETKVEMRGDEQLDQKDNHQKHRKRSVGDGTKKRKPGIPKPVEDGIGAKKEKKKRRGKHSEKRRLQLRAKSAKLKRQRSQIRKEIERANKRKEVKGEKNSRDTEGCIEKWAVYTRVGLGLATNVIKQVDKINLQIMTQFQVNSINASDKTVVKKKSKQDDFLEHQSILQQALTANPCDGGNANGKATNSSPTFA